MSEGLCWKLIEYMATDDDDRNWTYYTVETPDGPIEGIPTRDLAESIAALPILKRAVEEHERFDKNPQISAANTLIQLLGELRHVRSELRELGAALSVRERSSESRSSVEIKDSTRGRDITTKLYEGSPTDGLVDQAIAMYGEAFRRVQAESLNGWAETLAAGKPGGWAS